VRRQRSQADKEGGKREIPRSGGSHERKENLGRRKGLDLSVYRSTANHRQEKHACKLEVCKRKIRLTGEGFRDGSGSRPEKTVKRSLRKSGLKN